MADNRPKLLEPGNGLGQHNCPYTKRVSLLMSAILISSAATIQRINSNGVKKMCRNIFAVQHTMTASITGRRELSLDLAKIFYELELEFCKLKEIYLKGDKDIYENLSVLDDGTITIDRP